MEIYLPIAGLPVNFFILMSLGLVVGFLSGMFGVGGGFLMTPMLMLLGIPPAVAVASEANHILAASFSGFLAHMRRLNVDFLMGLILLTGGIVGSILGVFLLKYLLIIGQEEIFISLSYIFILTFVGVWMLWESLNTLKQINKGKINKLHEHIWLHGLPFKIKFRKSHLYISIIPPIFIGFVVGVLSSIMGVGGGFILVPVMIYIIGMPTKVVIGTSLFQIIFVTGFTTLLHSTQNYSVDALLALILLIGGVVGAQIGTRLGVYLKAEQLRILLAILVLAVCIKLGLELLIEPTELFSLQEITK